MLYLFNSTYGFLTTEPQIWGNSSYGKMWVGGTWNDHGYKLYVNVEAANVQIKEKK